VGSLSILNDNRPAFTTPSTLVILVSKSATYHTSLQVVGVRLRISTSWLGAPPMAIEGQAKIVLRPSGCELISSLAGKTGGLPSSSTSGGTLRTSQPGVST